MKKLIIITSLLVFFNNLNAQEMNKTKIDEKSQMEVLNGLCNRDGLKSNLFKTYYDSEYASYIPDAATITNLKTVLVNKNIKITIVFGSWCGDSQEQVPRFFKITDAIGFSDTNITIYGVDRSKKSDNGETDNFKITLVPTFILFKDGNEIGRITETPKVTIEKDIFEIVSL